MFERFTEGARQTVVYGQDEAIRLRHGFMGTEHLLLGLLHLTDDPAVDVLVRSGLDLATARAAVVRLLGDASAEVDAEALGAIGIDLSAVRESVEAAFGPGALGGAGDARARPRLGSRLRGPGGRVRFTGRAKKTLELTLREALALGHRSIRPGHILLGLVREGDGLAARVLRDHGLDLDAVRAAVQHGLG